MPDCFRLRPSRGEEHGALRVHGPEEGIRGSGISGSASGRRGVTYARRTPAEKGHPSRGDDGLQRHPGNL